MKAMRLALAAIAVITLGATTAHADTPTVTADCAGVTTTVDAQLGLDDSPPMAVTASTVLWRHAPINGVHYWSAVVDGAYSGGSVNCEAQPDDLLVPEVVQYTAPNIPRVQEDEPGWDCATMGNQVCGPVDAPLSMGVIGVTGTTWANVELAPPW